MQRSVEGPALEPRTCLDEQEVVDFAGGLLPAAKLGSVEAHLAGCDRCTALVAAAAPHLGGSGAGAAPGAVSPTQITASVETQAIGPTPVPRHSHGRERPRLAAGTALDATYQVVRFLGHGGMGDVYEVRHARLAGRYAAKLLSSDLANNLQAFSRFQREATIASGLNHPNIVNVIDFCHLPDGLPCLVMEFLDGVDLAAVMAKGPLSLARALRLVRQIVSALGTLHGHQIIHRDLKPQNIFVLPESDGQPERVKLVDFGLAKRSNPSMVVTHDRTLLGTPQYMAPEQAIGSPDSVGPESDQFSLAAIVYEMIAGRHPFAGDVLSTILYRIVHEPPAPLVTVAPDVPAYVATAIERALSKDRQARFPSVKAFLQALEGEGVVMTPAPVEIKERRSWFLRREFLASIGLLVATAGIVGFFRMWSGRGGERNDPPYWQAGRESSEAAAAAPRRTPSGMTIEPRPAIAAPAATEGDVSAGISAGVGTGAKPNGDQTTSAEKTAGAAKAAAASGAKTAAARDAAPAAHGGASKSATKRRPPPTASGPPGSPPATPAGVAAESPPSPAAAAAKPELAPPPSSPPEPKPPNPLLIEKL